jgi:hypothetical protein
MDTPLHTAPLTIGTPTNNGLYLGTGLSKYFKNRMVHRFDNGSGVTETTSLDSVKVWSNAKTEAVQAATVKLKKEHFASLPSYRMD